MPFFLSIQSNSSPTPPAPQKKEEGLQGLQETGLLSRSATASLLVKKLSVHEGRNIAYCSPGPEKQTHC